MKRVFISYSHKDTKPLEQLRRFLTPLEGADRLDAWDDNRIKEGDDWESCIDQALRDAAVAVLLVSQDFLASQFISKKELPYLLTKHQKGETKLLPVFLSPSNVKLVRPELVAIQGFGTPDKPLSTLTRGEREGVYQKLSERLIALADMPPDPQSSGVQDQRRRDNPTQPAVAYELSVTLQRDGANIATRYGLAGIEPFLTRTRSAREVDEAITPILRVLNTNDIDSVRNHLRTAPDHWGKLLFELLFGTDPKDHETVFRAAFHLQPPAAAPTAIRGALRLRIATDSPDLLGLPWRLTSWGGRLLINHGWVLSSGTSEDPDTDQVTAAPSEVLLVAPKEAIVARPGHERHLDTVEELLRAIWPSRERSVRRVHTAGQLSNALQGQRPHLVYVCAPLEVRSGRPCLMLDAPSGPAQEGVALGELAEHFRASVRPPSVLYLNTHGPITFDPTQAFGTDIPLVISRRLSQQAGDSADVAIAWLSTWLREGRDPVEALHRVCASKPFAESPEAQTLSVYASYRHWRTDVASPSAARERMAHLRLDREKQKGVVAKWVGELAASDTLRVMAMVPYSEPGNRLEDVQEQLCHHLDLALDDRVAIRRIRLEFPKSRAALRKDLEWELLLQLKADEGETPKHLLQRAAPQAVGKRRPALWLHWGVFGDNPGYQPKLKESELKEWLSFTGTFIPQHCPDNIRIVCSLAIETEREKHGKLFKLLNDKHQELDDPKYWLRILEPIGNVAENELFDYLKDDSSGCPAQVRSELAQRLSQKTGGEFESLVAQIQKAEVETFHALLDSLRREQGDVRTMPDEDL